MSDVRAVGVASEWAHKLELGELWQNDDLDFPTKRDLIVARFKTLPMYSDDWDLYDLVEELAATGHIDEFDEVWDELYDWADIHRVWIGLW